MNDETFDGENGPCVHDAAAAAVRRAWIKSALLQGAMVLAPTLAAIAASMFVLFASYLTLGDLRGTLWWLALTYAVALGAGLLWYLIDGTRQMVGAARHAAENPPEDSRVPGLAELDSHDSWRARAVTAPAALLAAVHLSYVGWSPGLAACAGLIGWLGIDLATLLTHPARVRLHHALSLVSPRPPASPEI